MKKLLSVMLMSAAMCLTACETTKYDAQKCKANLDQEHFATTTYTADEAKAHFPAFKFYDLKLTGAVVSEKTSNGKATSAILAFFFEKDEEATAFIANEGYENLTTLNAFLEVKVPDATETSVGQHNNVAYSATLDAALAALPTISII